MRTQAVVPSYTFSEIRALYQQVSRLWKLHRREIIDLRYILVVTLELKYLGHVWHFTYQLESRFECIAKPYDNGHIWRHGLMHASIGHSLQQFRDTKAIFLGGDYNLATVYS